MRATIGTIVIMIVCIVSISFTTEHTEPEPIPQEIKGPCGCEKGWNFIVHQITPQGCRQKSIYCTEGVELEPGYSCGTCPKPCSTCEEDEKGQITICRVYDSGRATSFKAECTDLQDYFNENGSFINKNDHCGPCSCADSGDLDSDGDGVCELKDDCPNDPNISQSGPCGCDDVDSDGDGICDQDEVEESMDVCDISGNSWYEWIESVVINGVTTKSGSNSNGYADFRHNPIAIGKGGVLSIWINPGHADAVCELSYAVFVDWNRDGIFNEEDERILNERSIGEHGIDYQLPDELEEGSYVMRIMIDLGRIYGACGGCVDGETEDYLIEIVDASCPITYDGFDYLADESLNGLEGGKNWSNGWTQRIEGDTRATIISGDIPGSVLANTGNKLGILNYPGSRITISREVDIPVFQKDGESWISFVYQRDLNTVFSPEINGASTGLYVNREGYLIIGGLKTFWLEEDVPYVFLIQTKLNAGEDELRIEINPQADGSAAFSQIYQTDIDGSIKSIGFEFWSAGTNVLNSAQYLDEVSVGCTKGEVLTFQQSTDELDSEAQSMALSIAPNPIQEGQSFVITLNNASVIMSDYTIYDTSGRMMRSGTLIAGENELNIQNLLSGIYFIEVNTNAGVIRQRLVVQNG